jgi:TorA maturation chaperone TorD
MALLIAGNRLSFREVSDFFDTHLGSWMEQFFADLARAESAEFYATVGRLGEAFLRVEKVYFSMPV